MDKVKFKEIKDGKYIFEVPQTRQIEKEYAQDDLTAELDRLKQRKEDLEVQMYGVEEEIKNVEQVLAEFPEK